MVLNVNVSQELIEIAKAGSEGRASQLEIEVAKTGADTRASQLEVEVAKTGAETRASQLEIEVAKAGSPTRASQLMVEVLILNLEVPLLPIYPDQTLLPGLAFNVKWSPRFWNMATQTSVSGLDTDLALADSPTHDFELNYEFLRDNWSMNRGSSEFKRMMGFFLRLGGVSGRFLFRHPDDNYVTNQLIVDSTDGVTNVFNLPRSFGVGEDVGTEDVGYFDSSQPYKFYMDGAEMNQSDYAVLTTIPGMQQLRINTTPAAGHKITGDFGYFYYCKFPDDSYTFEKFMHRLWLLGKINIHSCRPGG